jgi:tetratricopeptide (TPR) repeat protein
MRIWARGLLLLALISPAWAEEPAARPDPEAQAQLVLLNGGLELLRQKRPADAITTAFDPMIVKFDQKFGGSAQKVFTARTSQESLLYMMESAVSKPVAGTPTQGATAVSWVWSEGFYYKGYALIELGRPAEARRFLEQALAMAPRNARYLEELGDLNSREKNWPAALEIFKRAEEAARTTSPANVKNQELARAWRGQGYVLVEQNKLDEAEALYRQCLALDQNDRRAAAELKFVLDQKAKRGRAPK